MKCCPLRSDVEQQSQTITILLPPSPPAAPASPLWRVGPERCCRNRPVSANAGEMGCRPPPEGELLWKGGWHQEPQLPEETALETLNFNKITNSGRGGRQNSMCRFELAAWNTDLWTPLNHISFFLLGPAAFTQCGKRVERNLPPDKLLTAWAFTST